MQMDQLFLRLGIIFFVIMFILIAKIMIERGNEISHDPSKRDAISFVLGGSLLLYLGAALLPDYLANSFDLLDDGPDNVFFEGFEDYADGTNLYNEGFTLQVADDTVNFTKQTYGSEGVGELDRLGTAGRTAIGWDVLNDYNGMTEIYAEFQAVNIAQDLRPTIILSGSGSTSANFSAVRCEIYIEDSSINISEYDNGVWSGSLESAGFTFTEDEFYSVRAFTDGNEATLKIWNSSNPEPDTPQVTTSAITISEGDYHGIFEWTDENQLYPYTKIGAGIEGESAPKTPI